MKKRALLKRLLIAPFATVMAIYIALGGIGLLVRGPAFFADVAHKLSASETAIVLVVSLGVAYLATLLIGVPVTIALVRLKRHSFRHFLSTGLLGGVVLGIVGGFLTLMADYTSYRFNDAAFVGLSCCLITTVLMGIVWVIIRPDRTFSA
jgi:hypothetical protein